MGIVDDVIINAKSLANKTRKKAGDVFDISKLKISQAEISKDISNRFTNIGRLLYDSKKTGIDITESLDAEIEIIDDLQKKLTETNDQMSVLKNKLKCTKCGSDNVSQADYCSKCGTKLEILKKEQEIVSKECNSAECGCNENDKETK